MNDHLHEDYAERRGWSYLKTEQAREDAMNRLAQLDEELGL